WRTSCQNGVRHRCSAEDVWAELPQGYSHPGAPGFNRISSGDGSLAKRRARLVANRWGDPGLGHFVHAARHLFHEQETLQSFPYSRSENSFQTSNSMGKAPRGSKYPEHALLSDFYCAQPQMKAAAKVSLGQPARRPSVVRQSREPRILREASAEIRYV